MGIGFPPCQPFIVRYFYLLVAIFFQLKLRGSLSRIGSVEYSLQEGLVSYEVGTGQGSLSKFSARLIFQGVAN
jgi:hypothetical protein